MTTIEFEEFPNYGRPIRDAFADWLDALTDEGRPASCNHDIVLIELATHHRGRFLHSHKGKGKRQHALKTYYRKSGHLLKNCWPTETPPLGTLSSVLPFSISYAESVES